MGLRVGIDLVKVTTVESSIAEHGDHYLRRVYTDAEVRDCTGPQGLDPLRLASRFAAKEAAMKVLRVGDAAVPWPTIEVQRSPEGIPSVALHGPAAERAAAAGIEELALSFTHEDEYAGAVVVAQLRASDGQEAPGSDRSR
jgi:holo-[acyl-carrier protein] synthase